MDQKKIGAFLKILRIEKGMTQEELAEQFNVTNRTISRWETGSNMPDLSLIFELAEFYGVDLKEIVNGERKSENMDLKDKETLNLISDYAENDKCNLVRKLRLFNIVGITGLLISTVLRFSRDASLWVNRDFLYGFLEGASNGLGLAALLIGVMYLTKVLIDSDMKKSRDFEER